METWEVRPPASHTHTTQEFTKKNLFESEREGENRVYRFREFVPLQNHIERTNHCL